MKNAILSSLLLLFTISAFSQKKFDTKEISVNGFRNPAIGLEYRYQRVSVHAGYYTTAFKAGEATNFLKTGLTYWFFPVDKKEIPSSFYAGASLMRGLNRNYKSQNAVAAEAGFRWMFWKGFNARFRCHRCSGKWKRFKNQSGTGYQLFI